MNFKHEPTSIAVEFLFVKNIKFLDEISAYIAYDQKLLQLESNRHGQPNLDSHMSLD